MIKVMRIISNVMNPEYIVKGKGSIYENSIFSVALAPGERSPFFSAIFLKSSADFPVLILILSR